VSPTDSSAGLAKDRSPGLRNTLLICSAQSRLASGLTDLGHRAAVQKAVWWNQPVVVDIINGSTPPPPQVIAAARPVQAPDIGTEFAGSFGNAIEHGGGKREMTTKITVLYYSMYGHVEALARAVAQGAGDVEGVKTELKRVSEAIARFQGRHVARITRWLMQGKT
jgi:hypothetical protein